MNPTHNPSNEASEPAATGQAYGPIVAMLTSQQKFNDWLATGTAGIAAPADTEADGYTVTEEGLQELAKTSGLEPSRTGGEPNQCQFCGMPGCYPVCEISINGVRNCGLVPSGDESDRAGGDDSPSTCPVDLVTETDDENTSRVLRSAARYLERHGWIQGTYYDATAGTFTPAACLVGAIGMVCYGGPVDAPAQHFDDPGFLDFEAAVLHLDRYLLAEDGSESYEFNDAKGRAAWHVIQVLEDAAARPAHELIDALRLIEAKNADMAAMAELLVPSGAFAGSEGPDGPDGAPFEPLPPGKPWARCDNPRCVFCSRGSQSGGDVR
jgi:hypothetical protein